MRSVYLLAAIHFSPFFLTLVIHNFYKKLLLYLRFLVHK